MAPTVPPPPRLDTPDAPDLRRQLQMLLVSGFTILATVWCCTLGWLPAILSLLVAKHVLVAVLLMGLNCDGPPR